MEPAIEKELLKQLEQLGAGEQRQVLDFARTLSNNRRRGLPGEKLLRFSGAISADDLALMAAAIDEGCEQVNSDEW